MPAAAVASSASPPELSLPEGKLWCDLIERRSGLHFPESQWHYLRRRLWERMRIAAIPTYTQYYAWVAEAGRGEEWRLLLEDLLNPETSFFRHEPSFAALQKLIQSRKNVVRPYELWSAGCSTGEEAYSLAMTACAATGGRAEVLGTDLNGQALAQARAGVFTARQVAGVPAPWRKRFLREAGRPGCWEVEPVLRSYVGFAPFHLLDAGTFPKREFDVIFCFNVLIYFSPEARQEAAKSLFGRLGPEGYLFLAPGESAGLAIPGAEPVRLPGTHIWRRAS